MSLTHTTTNPAPSPLATNMITWKPAALLFRVALAYTITIFLTLIATVTAEKTEYPMHSIERLKLSQSSIRVWLCGICALILCFPVLLYHNLIVPYFQFSRGTVLELFIFRGTLAAIVFHITSPSYIFEVPLIYSRPGFVFKPIVDFFIQSNWSTSFILRTLRWLIRFGAVVVPFLSLRRFIINRVLSIVVSVLVMIYVGLTTQIWYHKGHRNEIIWVMYLVNALTPSFQFQNLKKGWYNQKLPVSIPSNALFVLSICYVEPGLWKFWYSGIDYVLDPMHIKHLTTEISTCRHNTPVLTLDGIPDLLMSTISFGVIFFEFGFPILVLCLGRMKYGRTIIGFGGMALHLSLGMFLGNYFYFTPLLLTYVGLMDYSSFAKGVDVVDEEDNTSRDKESDKESDKENDYKEDEKDRRYNRKIMLFTFLIMSPWAYVARYHKGGEYPFEPYPIFSGASKTFLSCTPTFNYHTAVFGIQTVNVNTKEVLMLKNYRLTEWYFRIEPLLFSENSTRNKIMFQMFTKKLFMHKPELRNVSNNINYSSSIILYADMDFCGKIKDSNTAFTKLMSSRCVMKATIPVALSSIQVDECSFVNETLRTHPTTVSLKYSTFYSRNLNHSGSDRKQSLQQHRNESTTMVSILRYWNMERPHSGSTGYSILELYTILQSGLLVNDYQSSIKFRDSVEHAFVFLHLAKGFIAYISIETNTNLLDLSTSLCSDYSIEPTKCLVLHHHLQCYTKTIPLFDCLYHRNNPEVGSNPPHIWVGLSKPVTQSDWDSSGHARTITLQSGQDGDDFILYAGMSVEDYYTRAKLFCETLKVSNAAYSQTFCMQTVFNSFASLVEENLNHAKQSEVSMMNAAHLLQQLIEQNNDDETQISMKHVPRDIFDAFMVVKKQR
jgi:hypothetical protein